VFLWCNGRCKDTPRRKRESESGLFKRQEKEELESIFKDLKGMHADKYSLPLLRLWARMISTRIRSDMNNPPDIRSLRGSTKKPIFCRESYWCCCYICKRIKGIKHFSGIPS